MAKPVLLIGVDPGGTTGIASLELTEHGPYLVDSDQWTDMGAVPRKLQELVDMRVSDGYDVRVIVEQFDKRPGIVNPDFSAKYVIQYLKEYYPYFEDIVWQLPVQAKTLVPEARKGGIDGLKRFDLYLRGLKHSRDAVRHCIVYAVEHEKHMPTILKGWPKK